MNNNIRKIGNFIICFLELLIELQKYGKELFMGIVLMTILYFIVLWQKFPYVNVYSKTGRIGFILLFLTLYSILLFTYNFVKKQYAAKNRKKRKEKFSNILNSLNAESLAVLFQFYKENSTKIMYPYPADELIIKGIVKQESSLFLRISQENLDFLTEFFK